MIEVAIVIHIISGTYMYSNNGGALASEHSFRVSKSSQGKQSVADIMLQKHMFIFLSGFALVVLLLVFRTILKRLWKLTFGSLYNFCLDQWMTYRS